VDSRSLGGERPDSQARAGSRTATCCTATPGRCLLLDPCGLVSVSSVFSVVRLCRSGRSRKEPQRTQRTQSRANRRAAAGRPAGGVAFRGADSQESASRNARRSGAWIRVRGEADDRRRIGGFAKPRRRASGLAGARRLADYNLLHRDSWALLAAGPLRSGLCVLCVLCGSSLSQRQKQKGTTEDTANTEQSKPKGGSRATGRRRGLSWRKLPGVCVTERAPIRRVDSRSGRSGRPQADRWIREASAASVRTRRRAPAVELQPAAPRLLGAACCWTLAVWSLCPLCSLWFVSVAAAEAERNHRGHREHRAEQTEGRQQGDRQLRCAPGGVAFRGADS
jgi:hypothetical protein